MFRTLSSSLTRAFSTAATAEVATPSPAAVYEQIQSLKQYYASKGIQRSKKDLRKIALSRLSENYISHEEMQKYRGHLYPSREAAKVPVDQRKHSHRHLLRVLKKEEQDRILNQYPRKIEEFHTGDKIAVVRATSLHEEKYMVVAGTVIRMHGGRGLDASFTIRNAVGYSAFDLTIPLNSPFLREIVVLEKRGYRRMKYLCNKDEQEIRSIWSIPSPTYEELQQFKQKRAEQEALRARQKAKEEEELATAKTPEEKAAILQRRKEIKAKRKAEAKNREEMMRREREKQKNEEESDEE